MGSPAAGLQADGRPRVCGPAFRLRDLDGPAGEPWDKFAGSPLFEHVPYEDTLRHADPERDVITNPWHRNIERATEALQDGMGPNDVLVLRGNFYGPLQGHSV